jgi:hypothetical protein
MINKKSLVYPKNMLSNEKFPSQKGWVFLFWNVSPCFFFFFPLTHGRNQKTMKKKLLMFYIKYLTLRSISSLHNLKNSKMKFCEKYDVDMLKIITIIID